MWCCIHVWVPGDPHLLCLSGTALSVSASCRSLWPAGRPATLRSALRTLAEVRHVVEIFEEVLLLLGERAALSGGSEGGRLGGELCVEVADVFFSHDGRDEWRCDFPMEKSVPIRVLKRNSPLDRSGNTFVRQLQRSHPEKRLLLHVLCVLLPGAQTPLRVPPQQLDSRNKTASRISSFRNRQTTGAGSDV